MFFEFGITIAHANTIVILLEYRKIIRSIAKIENGFLKPIIVKNFLNAKTL